MPQEFFVVRCFDCTIFQVQQSKKSPKWTCKMCGEKQSLKKVYGKGTGAQCRQLVQSLNFTNGELEEDLKKKNLSEPPVANQFLKQEKDEGHEGFMRVSKWTDFIDEPDDFSQVDIPDYSENLVNDKMVTTERPEVKRRGSSRYSTKKRRRSQESRIGTEKGERRCFDESEYPLSSKRVSVTSSHEYSSSSLGNFQDRFGGVAVSRQGNNCGRIIESNVETMSARKTSEYYPPSQSQCRNDENSEGRNKGPFQGGKWGAGRETRDPFRGASRGQVETNFSEYNINYNINTDRCFARQKFSDKTNNMYDGRHGDNAAVSSRNPRRSGNFVQLSDCPKTSDCANKVKNIGVQSRKSKHADEVTKVVKKSSKWSDFLDDEDTSLAEEDVYMDERDWKSDSTKAVTVTNAQHLFCLQDELEEDFLWAD